MLPIIFANNIQNIHHNFSDWESYAYFKLLRLTLFGNHVNRRVSLNKKTFYSKLLDLCQCFVLIKMCVFASVLP